jgi:hypothetical protein
MRIIRYKNNNKLNKMNKIKMILMYNNKVKNKNLNSKIIINLNKKNKKNRKNNNKLSRIVKM